MSISPPAPTLGHVYIRTRPGSGSRSPNLCGFCRAAAETTGDPELWRPVSAWLTAAGPGAGRSSCQGTDRGHWWAADVGGGRQVVRGYGRVPRGPRSPPTSSPPRSPPSSALLGPAGHGPADGVGHPLRPQCLGQAASGVGGRFCPERPHRGWGWFGTGSARQEHQDPRGCAP